MSDNKANTGVELDKEILKNKLYGRCPICGSIFI